MKWWQKALVVSLIFTGIVVAGVFAMKERIEKTAANSAEVDMRARKLGQALGPIFLLGNIAIWMIARRRS